MAPALAMVEKMRYNQGAGYFWINDIGTPVPTMIMHPTAPQLNNTVLSDSKYNCGPGNKNLFVTFVEATAGGDGGYVEYLWPNPPRVA